MKRVLSITTWLLFVLPASAQERGAPWYTDRANLLFYQDTQGRPQAVKTAEDWSRRVSHTRANMELVMGALPALKDVPLDVRTDKIVRLRHYSRQHVTFVAEPGDRVPAWLLVPHRAGDDERLPAMICLPGSSAPGKDRPAGLTSEAGMAYAHELAERGYVCLVVDYPLLHTAEYATDPYKLGYVSATTKGIVNHRRGVDLLLALPFVDREAIGVIGHSLGGHNALFLAMFDNRIKAVVSSCGFNVFAKHNRGDVRAWSSRYYMPRIKTVYGDDPAKIPFDFTEVLAGLAPRPVFVNAPLHDAPDFEVSGVRDCFKAAIPVYRDIFKAAENLVAAHPDTGHSFPAAERQAAYAFLDQHLRHRGSGKAPADGPVAHWPTVDKPRKIPAEQAPRLGKGDFSLAVWLKCDADDRLPGDLVSQYDPKTRRGFHLTLKSNPGVTSSQANWRHLQFGIDDNRASEWTDCGRPGNALLAFALAVHEGSLYASTCEPGKKESGKVYRFAGPGNWISCGAPDGSNTVTTLAVHAGALYAGTGKYRVAGSALPESENLTPGGRVFRYGGGNRWIDCGQLPDTEAVGGLVVFGGKLFASSLYKPAGFFRYEGEKRWTRLPVPSALDPATGQTVPKRVVSLTVHDGFLYAGSYDGGHVYRFDGENWTDCGRLGENTQTYSFARHEGALHVGTWRSGHVYRFGDLNRWTDVGRLGEELEVMGMLVHNGRLMAGTLPLAEVYSYEGSDVWKRMTRLDHTPNVTYRRAWTMAEHDGQVFCSTLPSGNIFAYSAGQQASWGHTLSAGWHHVAAVKSASRLQLYVDGALVGQSPIFEANNYELSTTAPLRLGTGTNGPLNGQLNNLRVWRRTLSPAEVRTLASEPPRP
ncbi:MAG: PQQ-binding-like beta-propeller repeat protein [Planctomycetes bacterium]|nr:PQQ-binding-like beta-propeller repeat protein [Planctomycetota bacterium]